VAQFPSSIPNGGRLLDRAEHVALERDMEAIVLGSHLFKSLGDTGRQELLESGVVMRFEAGDVVLCEGAEGDTMYLVMDGAVRVETQTPSGILQLAELRRGACVGEVSVLTGGPRTATVTAVTPVTMIMFARHRIARVLDQHPKVRALLRTLVEGRARDTVDKIVGG
jgi:CRP-like cAMP-binding protein